MRSDQDRKNNHLLLRYEQLNSDYLEQKADLTRSNKYSVIIWSLSIICIAFNISEFGAFMVMLYSVVFNFYQISSLFYLRYRLKRIKKQLFTSQYTNTHYQPKENLPPVTPQQAQKTPQTTQFDALDQELLNYLDTTLAFVRLRHRRQLHEIYLILNEMNIKNTALNIHQNIDSFDVKSIQQEIFLKLQQHMQTYLNYPATERFRFQSDLKSVPDLYLSQQLNRLLQDLLTLIQPLYTDDLNTFIQHQQFLQQQLNPTTPFQVYRE